MNIAVLVSGGVDSSVALRLLQDQGHTLTAFYLKIWLEDEMSFLGECPWEEDLSYVRAVCEEANVPLEVVPMQKEYHSRVVAYVLDEVRAGRTPNPDMLCNARVKFGAFYDAIAGRGFDKIATGHYAQVEKCQPSGIFGTTPLMPVSRTKLPSRAHVRPGEADALVSLRSPDVPSGTMPASGSNGAERKDSVLETLLITQNVYFLKKAPDPIKDQTYFLSQLTQEQLSRACFPIGGYRKSEVRALAEQFGLPNAKRKDSQGICFLGKFKFEEFLAFHLGRKTGKLIEYETGTVLGAHDGFWFYTLGQRHGMKLSGGPWYVVAKNTETNEVFVSQQERIADVARNTFVIGGMHWISGVAPEQSELSVKIRHGAKEYPCRIESVGDGKWRVVLSEKDRGIAPGQFAVLYDGENCLGGGVIE